MKRIRTMLLFAAVCMVAACDKDSVKGTGPLEYVTVTLNASVEGVSKAAVDADGKFSWVEGDKIGVNVTYTEAGVEKNGIFPFTADEAAVVSSFTGSIPSGGVVSGVAVYPYNASDVYSGGTLKVNLNPGDEPYTDPRPNMVAVITDPSETLAFKQLCALLKVTYANVPTVAGKLQVSSDKVISGLFDVNLSTLEITPSAGNTATTAVIPFEPVPELTASQSWYVPLPAGKHDLGVQLQKADGTKVLTSARSKAGYPVAQRELVKLPAIALTPTYEGKSFYTNPNGVMSPSLAKWNGQYYTAMRVGQTNCVIRKSSDGVNWEYVTTVAGDMQHNEYLSLNRQQDFQEMVIAHSSDFDYASDGVFSVSCWVFLDKKNDGDYTQIVSTRNGDNGYDFAVQSNKLIVDLGAPYQRIQSTAALSAREWHHVGFSFDGPNKKAHLFVDGSEVSYESGDPASTTLTTQANTAGRNIFVFAKAASTNGTVAPNGGRTQGEIKALRFWSKALTAAEMASDMNAAVSASTEDLIAGFDFTKRVVEDGALKLYDVAGTHYATFGNGQTASDLRAPKLLVTPDNRLMVIAEIYQTPRPLREMYVSYSEDGSTFSAFDRCKMTAPAFNTAYQYWLFSPKFYGENLYAIDYVSGFKAWKSTDSGLTFGNNRSLESLLPDHGQAETDLCFSSNGALYAFARTAGNAYLGKSSINASGNTNDFTFSELGFKLDNPNAVVLPGDTRILAAGRTTIDDTTTVAVYTLDTDGAVQHTVILDSAGTMGDPSLLVDGDQVLITWHSSSEAQVITLPLSAFGV